MKALTAEEMREVDRLTTDRLGILSLQLMETAGAKVAGVCLGELKILALTSSTDTPLSICVLCGKGNNGGDGFVAARHLLGAQQNAAQVQVYLFARGEDLRGDAASNYQRWTEAGGKVTEIPSESVWSAVWPEISAADVIVDAIFGTGFRGGLSGVIQYAINDINRLSLNATAARPALILAVDTPSGLSSDGQMRESAVLYAHKTVTFTAPKVGQLISEKCEAAGALQVVNIGSPAALVDEVGRSTLRWTSPEEFAAFPLVRRADSHKGLYGHALLIAGSLGKSGAAVMCGHAALRGGAGLVTIATPDSVLRIVGAAQPEYMSEPLASTDAGTVSARKFTDHQFTQIFSGKTVLGIGPGLGTHPETQEFIRNVVRHTDVPIVLDADGLNAFAGKVFLFGERKSKFLAITPHPGEMARLLDTSTPAVQQDRVKTALDAARKWNVHVVLKGFHTVIAAPDGRMFINTTGNPGLAKGGSGDVLTGLLAALTAQFKTDDWLRVLALGVYLHGKAAEVATRDTDVSGLLASEVADAVPLARRELLLELRRHD